MKFKLKCSLRFKNDATIVDIAEDINIIELPDAMSDADTVIFFNNLKQNIKKKYQKEILDMFDVDFTEIT